MINGTKKTGCTKFRPQLSREAILNGTLIGNAVSHSDLSDVLALYSDYCTAVTGHEGPHKPVDVIRRHNNEERSGGAYAVTTCFYVKFDNGTEVGFSYAKAVSAIANYSG